MADINLVNTDASEVYETVLTTLEQGVDEPLYPGDERRIYAEALVLILVHVFESINSAAKQTMLRFASGEVLDAIGERLNVYRIAATKAMTTVRFNVESALDSDVNIPQGTRVTADGVKYFYTTVDAIIKSGALYVDILCEAEQGGEAYNGYAAGTIITLSDVIGYISSISNLDMTHDGDDGEPYTETGDNHFRERIQLAPSALSAGTEESYEYYTKSADSNVIDVAIIQSAAGCVDIYPLMAGGAIPTDEEIEAIQAVVSASDVRAFTDKVTTLAPEQISYDINVTYYVDSTNESDIVQAVEGDDGAIEQYKQWQCAKLGRTINPDTLRKYIFNAGADRVTITSPTLTELEANQVASFSGTITVTHETI